MSWMEGQMTQIGSCNLANRLRDHNKQCALERNNELPSGMCRRPGNGLKIQPFVLALSVLNAAVANDRCTPNTPCDNLPALLSCGCPGTPLFNSVQWGSARKFFGTEAAASRPRASNGHLGRLTPSSTRSWCDRQAAPPGPARQRNDLGTVLLLLDRKYHRDAS